MIGAIAGDIIGSIHEGAATKTKHFELFGPDHRFTDDTVLTVAVAEWILRGSDLIDVFHDYVHRYPQAGYGGAFIQWALQRSRRPYHSWGNGSAMRVSAVGFACDSVEEVMQRAEQTASVTHDHPEGIRGAQATATAIFLARSGQTPREIASEIERIFGYDLSTPLADIRPGYAFDVSCQGSVPPAIRAVVEASGYEDAIRNAISLGGDADTMACIAGGIAEACWGVPAEIQQRALRCLDDRLRSVVEEFQQRYPRSEQDAAEAKPQANRPRWSRSDVCLEQAACSVPTLADEVYRRVCRTDFRSPGFCVIEPTFAIDPAHATDPVSLRALMVELTKTLGEIHRSRTGDGLQFLSAGRFDQQVTSKPHLDGGPGRSLLILGYEPSVIGSEVEIFDYTACAHDLGITPDRFLEQHNPMFPSGQAALSGYGTRIPCFAADRFQLVVVNNSRVAPDSAPPAWQGVLHAATIANPDESQRRVVNSVLVAPMSAVSEAGVSEEELGEFVHRAVVRRRGYDKPHLKDN